MKPSLYDLDSALNKSKQGQIESWVHDFLCGEGDNVAFSDGLKLEKRRFYGPYNFKLDTLSRCCGPEESMKYTIDQDDFERNVSMMVQSIKNGWKVPPLIVNFSDGVFELNDGNHRYEALVRSGFRDYHIIFWTTGEEDEKMFVSSYDELIHEDK